MDISVNIAGISFANPIILASGPMSNSKTALLNSAKLGVGGMVTKSSTIAPCQGNPTPVLVMRKGYLINADGIHNPGYKAMANEIKEAKQNGLNIPVIASVAGASVAEFVEMSMEFERMGADGIELNFVCPNRGALVGQCQAETLGRYWVENDEGSFTIVNAVKHAIKIPVWAKMPFDPVYKDRRIVQKMEEAGADAIEITSTMARAMALNLETGKPILGNPRGAGALGGYIFKPLGINCTTELSRIVKTPVIGSGGVFSGLDIVEYIMAGATMVSALTAIMQKVSVPAMLTEITDFMKQHGYASLSDFRGKTHQFLPPLI